MLLKDEMKLQYYIMVDVVTHFETERSGGNDKQNKLIKPEEVWSGQPKYCFNYTTLYQPCSSLWLIIVLVFKFGWLDLLRDLTFKQAGSSFTALQLISFSIITRGWCSAGLTKLMKKDTDNWISTIVFLPNVGQRWWSWNRLYHTLRNELRH